MVSEERYCNRVIFMRWSNERRPSSRAGIPGSPPQACELLFLIFFFHYKVVGDREYAGNAVDLHAGDCLVHLAGDYAFERDVAVLDDDVNGRNSAQLVLAQDLVAEDGAVGSAADSVVLDGGGQDLDIVDDFLDTFNVLDGIFGIRLENGTRDLAEQGHGAVRIDLVGKVVEYAVKRKHHEFMTDFLGDAIKALLTEPASWLVVLGGGTGESHHRENQWD